MRKSFDDRDYLVPRMQAYEDAILKELAVEQVTHIDLADYQPGQPHYEQLQAQLADRLKYQWPSHLTVNV